MFMCAPRWQRIRWWSTTLGAGVRCDTVVNPSRWARLLWADDNPGRVWVVARREVLNEDPRGPCRRLVPNTSACSAPSAAPLEGWVGPAGRIVESTSTVAGSDE